MQSDPKIFKLANSCLDYFSLPLSSNVFVNLMESADISSQPGEVLCGCEWCFAVSPLAVMYSKMRLAIISSKIPSFSPMPPLFATAASLG